MSWFSESRYLFLAKSKINHIFTNLGPPDSKCVGWTKNLPRNIVLWVATQAKSGECWGNVGVGPLKFNHWDKGWWHKQYWTRLVIQKQSGSGEKKGKKSISRKMQWILCSVTLLVLLQKGRILWELIYLKSVSRLSHRRYHGVLLWNGVTIDWLSVDTWFGICSAHDAWHFESLHCDWATCYQQLQKVLCSFLSAIFFFLFF